MFTCPLQSKQFKIEWFVTLFRTDFNITVQLFEWISYIRILLHQEKLIRWISYVSIISFVISLKALIHFSVVSKFSAKRMMESPLTWRNSKTWPRGNDNFFSLTICKIKYILLPKILLKFQYTNRLEELLTVFWQEFRLRLSLPKRQIFL